MPLPLRSTALAVAVLLSACAAGPDYVRPTAQDVPVAYKELGVWKTAEPRPAEPARAWWTSYGDPVLDALVDDAERANQTLRVAEAQYRQALAIVDQTRAARLPVVGATVDASRARASAAGTARDGNSLGAGLSASWQPDFWGAVRRAVEADEAAAQADFDTLAGTRLSIQASVVQNYLQLRTTDRLVALYAATTTAYARSLELTRAQYRVGTALRSDVALAESQLATAQAAGADLGVTRAQYEHAIAVLTGRSPANFSLVPLPAERPFDLQLPATPVGVPSELLERRPDIATAERRVAAANAEIGVARAAYYPTVTLSGSGGFGAAVIGSLFDAPSRVWSLGAALAQTVFDGGLRRSRDAQVVAAYDQTVANYKQTVLNGFQEVEDNLAALRILDQEAALQEQAVQAALLAERLSLSQYRAGTATYLSVVTAQQLSLGNQRAAVQLRGRQLAASVGLITATGGGFAAAAPLATNTDPGKPSS